MLDKLTPTQKQLALVGVPAVAVAALFATRTKRAASSAQVGVLPPMPSTDVLGTGQLANFESAVTDALLRVQQSIDDLENAGSPTTAPTPTTPAPAPPTWYTAPPWWWSNGGQLADPAAGGGGTPPADAPGGPVPSPYGTWTYTQPWAGTGYVPPNQADPNFVAPGGAIDPSQGEFSTDDAYFVPVRYTNPTQAGEPGTSTAGSTYLQLNAEGVAVHQPGTPNYSLGDAFALAVARTGGFQADPHLAATIASNTGGLFS